MKTKLPFIKMQGAGNDFVVIDCTGSLQLSEQSKLAMKLCDRHFGIGADCLLLIEKSDIADAAMTIYNSDGSPAKMCGNGIRCIGKYIYDKGICTSLEPTIETPSGVKRLKLHLGADGKVSHATVDMGEVNIIASELKITTSDGLHDIIAVSTGNLHGVTCVDDVDAIDIQTVGTQLECNSIPGQRINIEFVNISSPNNILQRTWERGVGETLACGTGACAAAVALVSSDRCSYPVTVCLKGGDLIIDKDNKTGHIMMTGPAEISFSGEFLA